MFVVGSTAMTQHIDPEHTLEILGDTLPRKVGMSPETLAMASKLSLAIGWMDARLPYSSADAQRIVTWAIC